MNIFISWSGERSKLAATALREWLCNVFQSASVWMSAHDMGLGSAWATELHTQLAQADFGLLCLTKANQTSPWLNYETGCLVIRLTTGRVVPYCLDLTPAEVVSPLGHLQGVHADAEGTRRLMTAINSAMPAPLAESRLDSLFDKWWSDLHALIGAKAEVRLEDEVVIARVQVELLDETSASLNALRTQLVSAIENHGNRLVIDLRDVKYATSSGWGVFINIFRQCYRTGGTAALVIASEEVREGLRCSRLDSFFNCFEDLPEAIAFAKNWTTPD